MATAITINDGKAYQDNYVKFSLGVKGNVEAEDAKYIYEAVNEIITRVRKYYEAEKND